MSTVSSAAQERIFLESIRWPTYLALLADLGEQRGRITYDRGRLEIVYQSKLHEHLKRLVGRLIETFTEELGIEIQGVSSTTLNRADLERGVEADECYHVQNEALVRDREEIDLSRDPPPDLVVAIEVSPRILARRPSYAAVAIPEIWRFDGTELRVCRLDDQGRYVEAEKSDVFPARPMTELARHLAERKRPGETRLARSLRAWVRARFEPR